MSNNKYKGFEFAVLDPTGVAVQEEKIEYQAGEGNRLYITINGHVHVFTYDGKYKRSLKPEEDVHDETKYGY